MGLCLVRVLIHQCWMLDQCLLHPFCPGSVGLLSTNVHILWNLILGQRSLIIPRYFVYLLAITPRSVVMIIVLFSSIIVSIRCQRCQIDLWSVCVCQDLLCHDISNIVLTVCQIMLTWLEKIIHKAWSSQNTPSYIEVLLKVQINSSIEAIRSPCQTNWTSQNPWIHRDKNSYQALSYFSLRYRI